MSNVITEQPATDQKLINPVPDTDGNASPFGAPSSTNAIRGGQGIMRQGTLGSPNKQLKSQKSVGFANIEEEAPKDKKFESENNKSNG